MDYSKSIAIVGLGGVFPGAGTLDRFWENIKYGVNSAGFPPEGRWPVPVEEAYSTVMGQLDRVASKKACFINDFSLDPEGLDIDRTVLKELDPLFHYLLHAGKEAFRDGQTEHLDRKRVGIIVGNIALPTEKSSALAVEYLGRGIEEKLNVCAGVRSAQEIHPLNRYVTGLPAGILAKSLGLGGGTMTLDAACASSLYAIRLASEKLFAGKADAMLAGGVSRPDSFYTQMGFSQLHALSPDGVSAPFGLSGNGLVVGEGAGLFLLKRLEDALTANDRIYGVIRATGLSNDVGGGLLAPSSEGQVRAMREAYKTAGLSPAAVDMIECHATGTPLGDSVEFKSLNTLWGDATKSGQDCVLGSVKGNVGHLLTAAGAAGLMKVLLSFENKTLAPTANFTTSAKQISLETSPFRVLTEPETWIPQKEGGPRRAAVSAFGFGGINAHMIVEEWVNKTEGFRAKPITITAEREQEPLAVVGMDADFGSWDSLDSFTERVLGKKSSDKAAFRENWWGAEKSQWFTASGFDPLTFKGFYKKDVLIPSDTFRIPPKELEEMLPQQSLMLKVAAGAIQDAGITGEQLLETGVFIGIALDMNTTNYHLRWRSGGKAREWAKEAGLNLTEKELKNWCDGVRNSAGSPLTANRTMGSLGSIIASRIAREFKFGGPAFTVSSEETSAFSALETAATLLRQGNLRQAVVGAVDLPGDIRAVLATHRLKEFSANNRLMPFGKEADGTVSGEGAGAVVLKRLDDAKRDGDRIYSVLKGVGIASGGSVNGNSTGKEACLRAVKDAYSEASVEQGDAAYIETHGSGFPEDDSVELSVLREFYKGGPGRLGLRKKIALGSVKADIGNTGAASGIASLIKTSLSLFFQIMPGIRGLKEGEIRPLGETLFLPTASQYWLNNSAEGKRVAGVSGLSTTGNACHLVLEEGSVSLKVDKTQPLGSRESGLFVIRGESSTHLTEELTRFKKFVLDSSATSIDRLAGLWFHVSKPFLKHGKALCFVSGYLPDLTRKIEEAATLLKERCFSGKVQSEGIFFTSNPVGAGGKTAFVYPGSGNHFFGMGRELSSHFPEILRVQERESSNLKSQYIPEIFWNSTSLKKEFSGSTAALLGQVAVGTLYTDLLAKCGVRPDAVIGYSLGETTGFFSTKAWRDRDGMLKRTLKTPLFTNDLAGEFHAAKKMWNTSGKVWWVVGLVDRTEEEVVRAIEKKPKVYLLIVNTPEECIIGGEKSEVEQVVRQMASRFILLKDVTIAHCKIVEGVRDAYRNLHVFKTFPPEGISFYSGSTGQSFDLNAESAADSVVRHAIHGIHFPNTIRQAYEDGVRVFVEPGPGNSCSRMIRKILGEKPHIAVALSVPGESEPDSLLALLARLISENVSVDLSFLYGNSLYKPGDIERGRIPGSLLSIPTGGGGFRTPLPPQPGERIASGLSPEVPHPDKEQKGRPVQKEPRKSAHLFMQVESPFEGEVENALMTSIQKTSSLRAEGHERFLSFSRGTSEAMEKSLSFQMDLLKKLGSPGCEQVEKGPFETGSFLEKKSEHLFLDRKMCMEFAVGRIGNVLGPEFAEIDSFPTRVRLPGEPLMLVDRILSIEGRAFSMTGGKVVTEHDIGPDSWYLDCNRIPTCIAVESGQADLFLSAYLGIDLKTRGLSMYRLLDAVVTFHKEVPGPGETIRYDIEIDHFFRQGETYLFRFSFEATVAGEPLLTMREGCAGFFSQQELDAGKGIVKSSIEKKMESRIRREQAEKILPMEVESYSNQQVELLRKGDLEGCFGKLFSGVQVREPVVIPGGLMALVHRVTCIDPDGGRFSRGMIRGEADIHDDDWFLTCHFVDDMVMPGTLMFECCLHTLRVYLLRMGWVFEKGEVTVEPVTGVSSRLKCRGQVTRDTKVAAYEIHIKETGYRPEPYAIVDAVMYADEKPIVEITDMSIQFSGSKKEKILKAWSSKNRAPEPKTVLYDNESILAFSNGKPSEAFGDRYKVFDKDRVIARLPGPPYKFLDRITEVAGAPWVMKEGHSVEAEYDVPPEEWYFAAHRQGTMPFSVLLEIALQPCGWLAAYMGSALTSETDLHFRNLGGSAIQYKAIVPETGTLTTNARCTKVSSSGGMIIQNYEFVVSARGETVYKGDTYFGFFTGEALQNQVGIRGENLFDLSGKKTKTGFAYPEDAPYPEKKMRMIDDVRVFLPEVGDTSGFVEGVKRIDSDEWFFKAHFYQDPVCPGSLGLESFLQLVKVFAVRRWGPDIKNETSISGEKHEWVYRGQILQTDNEVTVQAKIESVDDTLRQVRASGFLSVDGRLIYQVKSFGVQYE